MRRTLIAAAVLAALSPVSTSVTATAMASATATASATLGTSANRQPRHTTPDALPPPPTTDPYGDVTAGRSAPSRHADAQPTSRLPATPAKRFARETVGYGDQDTSPSHIAHVRELQYRLTWAGMCGGPVTGYFGDLTRAAVRRYQHRIGLTASGVAGAAIWRRLIPATVRGRGDIPEACTGGTGWDACYDRARHEATLWHDGRLRNAWLVRGGGRDTQTRTGDFAVYYRDIDHVSSLYNSPMPYSQFFSGGQAFHGSASMGDPFSGHSHGCINMYAEDAHQLWTLTSDAKLVVHVYGAWS